MWHSGIWMGWGGKRAPAHSCLAPLYLLNRLKAPWSPSSHETTPKSSKNSSLSLVVKEVSYLQVSRSPADQSNVSWTGEHPKEAKKTKSCAVCVSLSTSTWAGFHVSLGNYIIASFTSRFEGEWGGNIPCARRALLDITAHPYC